MSTTHNMITLKGIEQILLLVVDADPELKSSRPYGEFKTNNKRTEVYPVLFYEFAQGSLSQPQQKYNRTITITIGVAIGLIEGRINEIAMKSRAYNILEKTIIKLREAPEFSSVGIKFTDKDITIYNLEEQGDDLITGVFANMTFTIPVTLCIDDLPYLPLGSQANTYEPSDPSSLFCSLLNDCHTIEEMQDDIALLFALTGGTAFSCVDLEACSDYVSVSATTYQNYSDIIVLSAQTQSLSAITSLHTTQIIELQGLTGGTGGSGVGTLEQVTASGNTADRSIILQGDGGSFDLVRQVVFKDTNPILSGASDPSIGIDYTIAGGPNLLLRSPGPVLHLVGVPIVDSSSIPSVTDAVTISERTGAVSGVGFGFLSGDSRSFNYARLSAYAQDGSAQGTVFVVASGLTGSRLVSFPDSSGVVLLDSDTSTGGNGAADADKLAKYGDEGGLRASSNSGGQYAFRADPTFGGAGLGIFAANGQGIEVRSVTGKGGSIITEGDQIGLQVENNSSTTQPALDVTNAGTADIAHFEGYFGSVNVLNNGGLVWTTASGATVSRTNLGLATVFVAPGSNTYTAATSTNTIVGVVGSPVFTGVTAQSVSATSLSATTYYSGSTPLNTILSSLAGGTTTYVQPGSNTTTGGTPSRPTVNIIADPVFRNPSATTLYESTYTNAGGIYYRGGDGVLTNSPDWTFDENNGIVNVNGKYQQNGILLSALFAPISVVPTYVQNGTNTTTGGTITRPTVNVSLTPSFTSVSATTISATTFVQNGTALSSLFAPISVVPTYVQPGLNITTGGTASAPVVNLSGSIVLTAVTATGTILARDLIGTGTISGTSVTATTLVAGTINATSINLGGTALGSIYAPISVVPTYVQPGTNTTTGGTITRPTVNVSSTPSFTSVNATTATADTFYCGSVAQSNTTSVRLASNFVTSSATYVDVTALSFPVEANASYSFQFIVAGSSSGTTTGAAYALNGPASPTLISYMMQGVQSAGALFQHATSYDFGGAASTVAVANANYTYLITGTLVNGPNAGTLIVRAVRGGTANNITAKAGSSGLLTKTS